MARLPEGRTSGRMRTAGTIPESFEISIDIWNSSVKVFGKIEHKEVIRFTVYHKNIRIFIIHSVSQSYDH